MWLNKAGTTLIVSKTIPAVLVVILAKVFIVEGDRHLELMGEKFVCALQNPYTQGTHGVSMIGIVAGNQLTSTCNASS
jgi:hypothetical protein